MDAFDVLDIDAAAEVKPAKRQRAEAAPTVAEPPAKAKPAPKAAPVSAPPAPDATDAAAASSGGAEKPTGKSCKHEVAVPPGAVVDVGMIELTHPEVVRTFCGAGADKDQAEQGGATPIVYRVAR